MPATRATRAHPSPSGLKVLPDTTRRTRGKTANEVDKERIEESQESQEEHVDAPPAQRQTRSKPQKRTRAVSKESEEPKPKRARGGRSTKPKKQTQPQNDSSSDADLAVPGYFPSETLYNDNHDGAEPEAEAEMDEQRSTPTQAQAQAASSIHRRQFLTPKSPKPTPKSTPKPNEATPAVQAEPTTTIKSKTTALETTDPESTGTEDKELEKPERYLMSLPERELVYEKKFGRKMPKPRPFKDYHKLSGFVKDSVNIYGPAIDLSDDEEEDDEYMDGPSFTYQQLDAYRNSPDFQREKLPFNIPPQSTDSAQIRRKLADQDTRDKFQAARDRINSGIFAPRFSRPSTTPKSTSTFAKLVFTTRNEVKSLILDPILVDAIHALQRRADNDKRIPKTTQEMEAALESYYNKPTTRSPQQYVVEPTLTPTTTRERVEEPETPDQVLTASDEEDITNDGQASENSEVHQEPLALETPRLATSRPQESRIWNGISAVKNIMSTPLNYFRGRSQAAETTNEAPVTGDFIFRHSHNPPPIPESHHTTTPHRSVTHGAAHTDRRRRVATPHHRGPQTERRRRREDEEKPPMHLRGVLTADEIKARQRQQDREKAKQRAAREALEDEADDGAEDYMTQPTPSAKRKRPLPLPQKHITPDNLGGMFGAPLSQTHITPDNVRGMFCPPSTSSSDSSDDEEDEIQKNDQQQRQEEQRENERRDQYLREQSETPLYRKTGDSTNTSAASESLSAVSQQEPSKPDFDPLKLCPTRFPDDPYWIADMWARDPAKPMRHMNGKYIDVEGGIMPIKYGENHPVTIRRQERQQILAAQEAACQAAGEPYPISVFPHKSNRPIKPLKAASASILANSKVKNGTDGDDQAKRTEPQQTETQQAPAREPGPLEPKKWTQTPPPKPRPSNAQLPQQQAQPAGPAKQAEPVEPVEPETPKRQAQPSAAERLTMTALKHKPAIPSGLRNMTQMSPLEQVRGGEKENLTAADVARLMAKMSEEDAGLFDKDVQDAINRLDEKDMELGTRYYKAQLEARYEAEYGLNWRHRSEAEIAADAYFE